MSHDAHIDGRARPSRRLLLGGLAALVCAPAHAADRPQAWVSYEARLRAYLARGAFAPTVERGVFDLTNLARAERGAGACAWNAELAQTARAHAADLAARDYVEHLTPEGFDPSQRVSLLARRMIGSASENIAYRRSTDPTDAADLMGVWRKSAPHWTNLLRPTHSQVGFGVAVRGDRTYAVGLYGRPDGELGAPVPFRLGREIDLAGAVSRTHPPLDGFAVSAPVDDGAVPPLSTGEMPVLAPGVYQLRPQRRIEGRRYQVMWGPIFVRT